MEMVLYVVVGAVLGVSTFTLLRWLDRREVRRYLEKWMRDNLC
jgi:putative copper export protein